jgi:hypothetical protein
MDGRYTFASDIYQVGMILYEMVNGPMDYSYAHYLLPKQQSRLARDGTCYESLDPFEQALLNRECIKTLCRAQKLLSHGKKAAAHFSRRLSRIIRTATHPDLLTRFNSALAFQSTLTRISVPNWKTIGDKLIASNWHGWDWRAYTLHRRTGEAIFSG